MTYGLIGEHLPHSFSKEIHALCADYEYELLELSASEVGNFMKAADFSAINVTIPYKKTVMPYLDVIQEQAKSIGAVNTVVKKGGKLYGYNTDFYGMLALVRRIGIELKGKKVLILGNGGTARTARAVAVSEGARKILTVGRSPSAESGTISYSDAYKIHSDADVIFNTTPCGMFPFADGGPDIAATPIDISRFPDLCGVIDAVYNPLRTNLIMDAKAHGIPAEGGLYMLVAQAVVASRVFLGAEIEAVSHDEKTFETIEKIYSSVKKSKENIVLTGMPGSGKSTVGKALAEKLGRQFLDTDALIKEKTGKEITEIFSELGEEGFRKIESDVVRGTANNTTGAVIATGGGAVLKDENVRALGRSGRIYFLNRSLDAILPTKDRPLASSKEALQKRFDERYSRYLATADREIVTDEIIEHTISAIKEDFYK